jgi:hypothetical protein
VMMELHYELYKVTCIKLYLVRNAGDTV